MRTQMTPRQSQKSTLAGRLLLVGLTSQARNVTPPKKTAARKKRSIRTVFVITRVSALRHRFAFALSLAFERVMPTTSLAPAVGRSSRKSAAISRAASFSR